MPGEERFAWLRDDIRLPAGPTPPAQRHSDTSVEAAHAIESTAATLRGKVMRLLQDFSSGMTDEEIQEALGMNPSTERPRRVELVVMGLVEDSGVRKLTHSGRRAVVWRVV